MLQLEIYRMYVTVVREGLKYFVAECSTQTAELVQYLM